MRTKIIATLGPATNDLEAVRGLVQAGARIFRLNFSHGGREGFEKLVGIIRGLEKETGETLAILQDLSGPKIRTCDIGLGTLEVTKGAEILLGAPGQEEGREEQIICLDQPEILRSLKPGEVVALSDGMLRFTVTERLSDLLVRMTAVNAGIAPPRKGISFPGKSISLEAVTAKDRADLEVGLDLGVDMVAISYVQKAEDVARLKSLMRERGRVLPIVAKLERPQAIQNLDRIIEESDGIMVARGDLGLECDLPTLPALQKRIIRACNRAGKPVIVATQMLLSMVSSPMPTRAETTDVANAILDGSDCIMLSEETAIGRYPSETVRYMGEIAMQAEAFHFEDTSARPVAPDYEEQPGKFLAYAACLLADKTRSRAIVCHSRTGSTARILSACRPRQPIYALSGDDRTRHFTQLSWGVLPAVPPEDESNHQERCERFIREHAAFLEGDSVILTAGQPTNKRQLETQTNVVKVYEK
ncbi:MAG: pyruvate kinase [Desulfovibrio sp.]